MNGEEMRKQKLNERIDDAKRLGKQAIGKVGKSVDTVLDWVIKNPDKATIICTGIAVAKKWIKDSNERTYEDKRKTYWDGRYPWELKRPMRNDEMLMLQRRLDRGERAGDILEDMGLLKRKRW